MFDNSINKVFLLGRLGDDPKLKQTLNGIPILKINIATNESRKDKNNNIITQTEWHKITFYNNLAENIAKFTRKGSLIFIEGSLRTNKWLSEHGEKKITEIIASKAKIISTKNKENESNEDNISSSNENVVEDDFLDFNDKKPF